MSIDIRLREDADPGCGHLRVAPGTHRAIVWSPAQPGLDLKTRDLMAQTGDVTIHLSCTLHMAVPPVYRTRKVAYTRLDLRPPDAELAAEGRTRLQMLQRRSRVKSLSQDG